MAQDVYTVRESNESRAFLDDLRDKKAAGQLRARIDRAREGNFGNAKSVGGGVYEMVQDSGPSYRLYYFRLAKDVFHTNLQSKDFMQTSNCRAAAVSEGRIHFALRARGPGKTNKLAPSGPTQ